MAILQAEVPQGGIVRPQPIGDNGVRQIALPLQLPA
jgi:hypothetical protein